jgi:hypothetical protein
MMRVIHFYLTTAGYGKSLSRCFMCFNLSHGFSP